MQPAEVILQSAKACLLSAKACLLLAKSSLLTAKVILHYAKACTHCQLSLGDVTLGHGAPCPYTPPKITQVMPAAAIGITDYQPPPCKAMNGLGPHQGLVFLTQPF
ncbi:MAG: hypothetical protein QME74_08135 [Candidatus Edwardsbacteria bacterium]|nr:hypothetical protein [Candidatus Edwardsbacteria bacterium]